MTPAWKIKRWGEVACGINSLMIRLTASRGIGHSRKPELREITVGIRYWLRSF